jgi:hypothetical protein
VIQRLSPVQSGLDEDAQVLLHPLLADVLFHRPGAQGSIQIAIFVPARTREDSPIVT